MKMSFERLLNDKKIEVVEKKEFLRNSVEKSLNFAGKGLETGDYNWVMVVAYEIVLKTGNKFMNFLGYRAIGKEHHKNLFEFLKEALIDEGLVGYFNKIRIKRNDFIYRDVERISREEAEEILKKAEMLVHKIRTFVHKIRTGDK